MSIWLNVKKRMYAVGEIDKPCHECGFCPYGQLVEAFPIRPGDLENAEKLDLWMVAVSNETGKPILEAEGLQPYIPGKFSWKPLPNSTQDWTRVPHTAALENLGLSDGQFSCGVFGHDCPVYYTGEFISE